MSRQSIDWIENGIVRDGFDYTAQVWVKNYIIVLAGSEERTEQLRGKDIRSIQHEVRV